MPRRSSNRISLPAALDTTDTQARVNADPVSGNLHTLRHHWKWAAFCQFFFTFFDLIAINDISIEDIETDLSHGTDVFLPRLMQRLLFTLSYDRKITAENWQNALRRQFDRRNPEANPLGSQSTVHTAANSRFSSVFKEETEVVEGQDQGSQGDDSAAQQETYTTDGNAEAEDPDQQEGKSARHSPSPIEHKATVDWSDLSMDQKLEALHTLIEWQFQNPTRLRHIMKSEDEDATWRAEPIGYDREQNAYWLIGGNRLWIQRAPPRPPTRKRKRKAPAETKSRNASKPGPSKRQRVTKTTKAAPTREAPVSTPGRSRAAKEQAKIKLDAQAKALAEFNRQAAAEAAPSTSASTRATRSRGERQTSKAQPAAASSSSFQSAGVRISARLRGQQDDGWQSVPEEWLKSEKSPSKNTKTGLETDDESSDLTELSDEDMDTPEEEEVAHNTKDVQDDEEDDSNDVEYAAAVAAANVDFIEWETICITLAEWEHFPERFSKSTHYTEKAFYKFLTNVVVPEVVGELKAIDQKRRLEEALNHRKRSSRLATRENEKETARLAAQKRAEEEEKQSRSRRLEARLQREEAERVKRERAREERRMKRETQAHEKDEDDEQEAPPPKEEEQTDRKSARSDSTVPTQSKRRPSRQHAKVAATTTSAADDWELECEVCGRKGKNLDDGTPMMSCGSCLRWHHIQCHDKRDRSLGRPKRDWDRIEFFCQRCLALRSNALQQRSNGAPHPQQQQQHLAPAIPYPPQPSWQAQAPYYTKPQGIPGQDPSPYSHSYLAPTSSLRSSYPVQPAAPYVTNNGSANNISFSHYQPQERAFTSEANRAQVPYYRMNGSWGGGGAESGRYQAYPPQPVWNPNHHAPNVAPANPSFQGSPLGPPAVDRQHHHPYENSVQHPAYDNLASREAAAYRQAPTSTTVPPVSYHRTPYPPHP